MDKEKLERTKSVVSVGTIGRVDRSKIDDDGRRLAQGLIKERDDWCKWRQSSKFRGVRR